MKKFHHITILLTSVIVIMCFACTSSKKETEKKVSQFMGDTLKLPEKTEVLYKDSLYKKKFMLANKATLKIPTLLWGECHSCIADLKKWDEFYQFIKEKDNVTVLFYLYTSDLKFFRKSLYKKEIHKYPFIVDRNNRYLDNNDLPFKNKMYQTFLLDSNNRVILVGNPVYNDNLMKLYKEEINKRVK